MRLRPPVAAGTRRDTARHADNMNESTLGDATLPGIARAVERLRMVSIANIGDVLRGLGLNCIEPGIKPLLPGWSICGRALTMRLIPLQDPHRWYESERPPLELIKLSRPGDVFVIDSGGDRDFALWGGYAAEEAARARVGGIVIDGVCRDSLHITSVGVPTFARGTSPMHGHGVYGTTCFNDEPVRIGRISIAPGDIVAADADGITVIPANRVEEIAALAQERYELDTAPRPETVEARRERQEHLHRLYNLPDPPAEG